MACMVQLGMVGLMPSGTKIAFRENCLEIQRAGFFSQSVARTGLFNPDSHHQLDRLKEIIENAISYYRPSQDKLIQEIFYYASKGLVQLQNTYTKEKVANVPGNLANFITLLKTNVPGISAFEETGEESITVNSLKINELEESNIPPLIKKIIAIWTKEGYEEILEYFRQAKCLQGTVPVDVQEKGTRELELLGTFLAHKANKINYVFATETNFRGRNDK